MSITSSASKYPYLPFGGSLGFAFTDSTKKEYQSICNHQWNTWHGSKVLHSWSRDAYGPWITSAVITTSTNVSWTVQPTIKPYTLCDGLPRYDISPAISTRLTTSTTLYKMGVEDFNLTVPACEIVDMMTTWTLVDGSLSSATPEECSPCDLFLDRVQLLYWPVSMTKGDLCAGNRSTVTQTPTGIGPNTAVINETITLTSPTVYLAYETIYAISGCGSAGKVHTSGLIAMSPDRLSSMPSHGLPPGAQGFLVAAIPESFNFANLPPNPLPFSVWSNEYVPRPQIDSNYWFEGGITHALPPVVNSTIYSDYNPFLSFPTELFYLDPVWSKCTIRTGNNIYDPPRVLHSQTGSKNALVITSSHLPIQSSTAAAPGPSAMSDTAPSTARIHIPAKTTAAKPTPPRKPVESDISDAGPPQPSLEAFSEDSKTETASFGGALPAPGSKGTEVKLPDPSEQSRSQARLGPNSLSAQFDPPLKTHLSHVDHVPTESDPFFAMTSSDLMLAGSQTLTVQDSRPTIAGPGDFSAEAQAATISDPSLRAGNSNLMIGSGTAKGPAREISDYILSQNPTAVIVAGNTKTQASEEQKPIAILTLGSEMFTASLSAPMVIGSVTIVPQGPAASISSEIISLAASAVVVGTKSYAFTAPAPTAMDETASVAILSLGTPINSTVEDLLPHDISVADSSTLTLEDPLSSIAGQAISANSASATIRSPSTLALNGPPTAISGQAVRIDSAGATVLGGPVATTTVTASDGNAWLGGLIMSGFRQPTSAQGNSGTADATIPSQGVAWRCRLEWWTAVVALIGVMAVF